MNADHSAAREARVNEAIADYLEAADAGRAPQPDEFIARHPDIATELKAFFADRDQFQQFASPVAPASPRRQSDGAQAGRPDDTDRMAPTLAPSEPTPVSSTLGTVRYFGDYELLEEIARGGMGVVYKARQVSLKRTVALKMILAGQLASAEDIKRFHAEAEAAAKLDHPNIVPIFEVGDHEGQHYFSMAFVEGESLAHRAAEGVLAPRDAAELMRKIAQAVAYAHVEGVVHRDLKPANVLIDKDGQPRVTDFGLAKRIATESHTSPKRERGDVAASHSLALRASEATHAAASLTATGQILGTPSYMPPEQAAGRTKEIGPLSDVYSLGAILYCLLTGRPPFQAATPLETILQVLEQDPVSPRLLNASVPRDLETICMKCLEKEPRRRYASAQELADELGRFLTGEPIHARPIGVAERSWRWLKKQQRSAVVGTIAALAAAVLVVASFTAWRLYEQSQLGYLTLKTGSTDSSVLVAELFDERDEPVAAAFTVPTKEPVPIVAGSYRLRISGSGSLSETWLLDVDPGSEPSFTVGLGERKLGEPVRVSDLRRFEIVELDGGPDFIEHQREGPGKSLFRRISGATRMPIWEVDLTHYAPEVAHLVKTPQDELEWGLFSGSGAFGSMVPLSLVKPAPDLDGDGIGDLLWMCDNYGGLAQAPVLVAMSGRDGKPLWWARQKRDVDAITKFIGTPLVVRLGDAPFNREPEATAPRSEQPPQSTVASGSRLNEREAGSLTIVAEFISKDKSWIEAFSGRTSESLWRYDIDPAWIASSAKGEPYEPSLARVSCRAVVVTVVGVKLIGIDVTTGQPAWPPHDLRKDIDTYAVVESPRVADLNGDGSDEILLVEERNFDSAGGDPGLQLSAVSLATLEPLWQTRLNLDYRRFKQSGSNLGVPWPVVAELDGDPGAPRNVIVPIDGGSENQAWHSVDVLNGATGQRRWTRRFPINLQVIDNSDRAADRYAVGPDLDGDGIRELFVVSARTDLIERGGDTRHPSQYSLFVDCLSGKDGHSIWWSRIPLGDVLPMNAVANSLGPVSWGSPGPGGRPSLVVPVASTAPYETNKVSRSVFSFCTSTGRVLHVGPDLWPPVAGDFNRDGIIDLCSFVTDDPRTRTFYGDPPNPAGKFVVFRGMPPESFRRFGAWDPAADFDGDGNAELFRRTADAVIASGRDGRITARWKPAWGVDGIHGGFRMPSKYPLALPHGDLNSDGAPDVLLAATHQFFDQHRNRPNLNRPGRLFFPLQAISGKTGDRLWLAQDIPDPVHGNHASLHVKAFSPTCDDLDGHGSPDVLCPFSCFQLDTTAPGGGFPRQLGLARFSGSDGTLRWTQMIEDEIDLNKGMGGVWEAEFTPLIATTLVDLNADGVRDILVTVALRRERGSGMTASFSSCGVELIALDGRDGKRLWQRPLARQWRPNAYPNTSPQPACGDIDGDGRPEVVTVESGGMGGPEGIWTQYKVTALDGQTGEPKWTWQYTNPSRSGDPVAESDWPRVVLADLDGTGHPSVCVGVHDRSANDKSAVVVLNERGEVRARYDADMHIWAADVDGDGRDELLYVSDGKVRATRGPADATLWEWPLPGGAGGIVEIRPGERRQPAGTHKPEAQARESKPEAQAKEIRSPATIIVAAAGESTIDSWGRGSLDSLPPDAGFGACGDSIYGLDGASGKPIWRAWHNPGENVVIPSRVNFDAALAEADSSRRQLQLPYLVSRVSRRPEDQYAVSRVMLPTEPTGEFRLPPTVGVPPSGGRSGHGPAKAGTPVPAPDPRLVRTLPWVRGVARSDARHLGAEQLINWFQPPAYLGLYSLVVLVIPAWLLRGVWQRRWTLTSLLLVPVAFAVGFTGYKLTATLPGDKMSIPNQGMSLALQLLETLPGLPVLAFPAFLVAWTIRGRWRRLAWLLGGSLVLSLVISAVGLWIDSRGMDPSEHYSWTGWYLVLVIGSLGATSLTLAAMLVSRTVQAIRRLLYRRVQAA